MDNDFDIYKNPIEGKTYISPEIKNEYGGERTIRLVTRGIDSKENFRMVKEDILMLAGELPLTERAFQIHGHKERGVNYYVVSRYKNDGFIHSNDICQ